MTGLDELRQALSAEADDVCSGAELLERVPPARRSSRRRVVAAVAAGVAIAATVSVVLAISPDSRDRPDSSAPPASKSAAPRSTAPPPSIAGTRVQLNGEVAGTLIVPAGWDWQRSRGSPSVAGSNLIYVANQRLGPQCESLVRASCPRGAGMPREWQVGHHEVVIVWSQRDLPTISVPTDRVPGRKISIKGRPAWIKVGSAKSASCPRGAVSSITATVDVESSAYPALRYVMTACLGAAASARDRGLIYGMLRSLDIEADTQLRTVGLSFGAHVDVPASWYSARYRGIPGTLGSPDWYLSTAPLDPACTIRSPQSCLSPNWFPARWQPPDSGALMLWATYEDPVAARVVFRNLPGHRTTLDGRPAKLYQGTPTDSCPTNTYRELDAYVQRGRLDTSSPRFQLTACFGRAATPQIRRSVLAMVHSFRIGN